MTGSTLCLILHSKLIGLEKNSFTALLTAGSGMLQETPGI